MGYERMAQVDGMGQFSIRGGIIDIFPLTEELPIRIELWDDEVDSIRSFDLESQRSVEQLSQAILYPATEMAFTSSQIQDGTQRLEKAAAVYEKTLREQRKTEEAHRISTIIKELKENLQAGIGAARLDSYLAFFCDEAVSFQQYFPEKSTAVFLEEPARLKEKGETVELEFRESMIHRLEKGYLLPEQTSLLYSTKETLSWLQTPYTVLLNGLGQKGYCLQTRNVNSYQSSFEILIKDLQRWKKEKYRVILLSGSYTRASRLAGDLREYGLSAF